MMTRRSCSLPNLWEWLCPVGSKGQGRSLSRGPGAKIALIVLPVLVIQNAGQAILFRFARTRATGQMFYTSTAVFWSEVAKLAACSIITMAQQRSISRGFEAIRSGLFDRPLDTLRMAVPSLLFTVYNNLMYVAARHLDAATFMVERFNVLILLTQVTVQLKIFTTAIFSMVMFGRRFSIMQLFALFLLFSGVSIVQLQDYDTSKGPRSEIELPNTALEDPNWKAGCLKRESPQFRFLSYLYMEDVAAFIRRGSDCGLEGSDSLVCPKSHQPTAPSETMDSKRDTNTQTLKGPQPHDQNPLLGLLAVLGCCLMSGYANTYLERQLKKSLRADGHHHHDDKPTSASNSLASLWMKNMQLSLLAIPISFGAMAFDDWTIVTEKGLFYGFDFVGWSCVACTSFGGLLVALAVTFADSVVKTFATSVGIVLVTAVSIVSLGFVPQTAFIVGTPMVILSVYLYSL